MGLLNAVFGEQEIDMYYKMSILNGKWPLASVEDALSRLSVPKAVVNVVYREGESDIEVLVVKRRVSPWDRWSGDVGFPGGGVKRDESLVQAVLRETREEVGIPEDSLVLEGSLGVEWTIALPGLRVFLFLSRYVGREELRVLWSELSGAWWVPLGEFKGPVRMFHPFKGLVVEAYVFKYGLVWGLSKRVLDRIMLLFKDVL